MAQGQGWRGCDFYPRPPRGGRRGHAGHNIRLAVFLSTPSARRATPSGSPASPGSGHFYPRPPRGGRRREKHKGRFVIEFLSTPSARRATPDHPANAGLDKAFLSTPSARRATNQSRGRRPAGAFLSTPSARRATRTRRLLLGKQENFYPRPPRGGRPAKARQGAETLGISIHALREEGDRLDRASMMLPQLYFYPRPPRGGRRCTCFRLRRSRTKFLSTPSARRATVPIIAYSYAEAVFLSTPSARRATTHVVLEDGVRDISIHALREEGDLPRPVRRAAEVISIHALREEGDSPFLSASYSYSVFLSTPSARRATQTVLNSKTPDHISIHALREEGD